MCVHDCKTVGIETTNRRNCFSLSVARHLVAVSNKSFFSWHLVEGPASWHLAFAPSFSCLESHFCHNWWMWFQSRKVSIGLSPCASCARALSFLLCNLAFVKCMRGSCMVVWHFEKLMSPCSPGGQCDNHWQNKILCLSRSLSQKIHSAVTACCIWCCPLFDLQCASNCQFWHDVMFPCKQSLHGRLPHLKCFVECAVVLQNIPLLPEHWWGN